MPGLDVDVADMMEPGSEDNTDDDSDGGYDSVHTSPSNPDELYHLHVPPGELSEDLNEDYGEYLHDALAQQEHVATSDSEGEAASGASSPSRLATPPSLVAGVMDIGIFDLEFSEHPDFLGEEHTDDSHETDSDGELSNIGSEDDDDPDEEFDEVPNP